MGSCNGSQACCGQKPLEHVSEPVPSNELPEELSRSLNGKADELEEEKLSTRATPPLEEKDEQAPAPDVGEEPDPYVSLKPASEAPPSAIDVPMPDPSGVKDQELEKPLMDQVWERYTSGAMNAKEKQFFADKVTSNPRRPSSLNISLQSYAEEHSKLFAELRSYEAPDGWTFKKSVDTVDIFTKTMPGEDMLYTKGVTTIKLYGNNIRHCLTNMLAAEDRPKYDEVCSSGLTVESYLPHYRIVTFQIKAPAAIVSNREICLVSRLACEDEDNILVAIESVEHPSVPIKPEFVRVTGAMGGYIIRKTDDPDVIKVMFAIRADPNGWLPGWVKNMIAWKSQLVLGKFKRYYEDTYGTPKK